MEDLVFFIIVVAVVLVKLVRALQQQNQERTSSETTSEWGDDAGWEEWEPIPASPVPSVPKPEPAQYSEPEPPRPMHAVPAPAAQRSPQADAVIQRARLEGIHIRQIDQHTMRDSEVGSAVREAYERPAEPAQLSARDMMDQALSTAFPAAIKAVHGTQRGHRGPIRVRAYGKKNLRQAVLLSEVIGQPRAFDL